MFGEILSTIVASITLEKGSDVVDEIKRLNSSAKAFDKKAKQHEKKIFCKEKTERAFHVAQMEICKEQANELREEALALKYYIG